MLKEWYILINKVQEGPFSLLELKRDLRITPDTLVWKKGFTKWIPIGKVPELKELFEDEEGDEPEDEELTSPSKISDGQMTLSMDRDPFQLFFWLIVAAIIFAYLTYQFNWTS